LVEECPKFKVESRVRKSSGQLREQLVGHVPDGPALPVELVRNAAIGSALVLAGAVAALVIVPDPESIRHGGFFLIAAGAIGDWAAGLKGAAGPLALLALLALTLDAYLWSKRPTEDGWRYFCIAQPWTGLGTVGACLVFVLAVMLTLALWIMIVGAIIAGAVLLLGAITE
jgi:hypothetical protein